MTIIERSRVLHVYLRALYNGARSHEHAVAAAAEELCLAEEAVIDAVRSNEAEAAL